MQKAALLIALMCSAASTGYTAHCCGGMEAASAQKQEQAGKVKDPVCGMQIDSAKAAGKSDYKGKTYYFCSGHCKKTFDSNPEAVLNKGSGKKQ